MGLWVIRRQMNKGYEMLVWYFFVYFYVYSDWTGFTVIVIDKIYCWKVRYKLNWAQNKIQTYNILKIIYLQIPLAITSPLAIQCFAAAPVPHNNSTWKSRGPRRPFTNTPKPFRISSPQPTALTTLKFGLSTRHLFGTRIPSLCMALLKDSKLTSLLNIL